LITIGGKPPEVYAQMLNRLKHGARVAGEDLSTLWRSIELNVGYTENADRAISDPPEYWAGTFIPALFDQKTSPDPDEHVRFVQQYARSCVGAGSSSRLIDHSVQVSGCAFNVEVLVLTGSAFRRQHSAAVHVLKISVRELVVSFAIFGLSVVNAQVPASIFAESMLSDELVLFLCGRLVLAPCVSFVGDEPALANESLGVLVCRVVQLDCHDSLCAHRR
jgi:hypothetical protein